MRHTFVLQNLHVRRTNAITHNKQRLFLDNSPGKYECKFMADGKVKASIEFEVKDGKIVKNKCDDNINLPSYVTGVTFKDKGVSTVKVDRKLKSKLFYTSKRWAKGCPAK